MVENEGGRTAKRVNVTVTAYEGDVPFPEAAHYPDFVATSLEMTFPEFDFQVTTGPRTMVHVSDDPGFDLEHEIEVLVKVDLWDAFCTGGYKAYAAYTKEHNE